MENGRVGLSAQIPVLGTVTSSKSFKDIGGKTKPAEDTAPAVVARPLPAGSPLLVKALSKSATK